MCRPVTANATLTTIIDAPSTSRKAIAPPELIKAAPVNALRIAPRCPKASAVAVPRARTKVG